MVYLLSGSISPVDSLLSTFDEQDISQKNIISAIDFTYQNNLDSLIYIVDKGLNYAVERNDEYLEAYLEFVKGRHYCETGYLEKAKNHLDKSLNYNFKNKDPKLSGKVYFYLATTLSNLDDYETPLALHAKGLELFKEFDEEIWMLRTYVSLGWVHRERGEQDKATSAYIKALKLAEKNNSEYGMFDCLHELGYIYLDNRQFAKADSTFHLVLDIANKLKSPQRQSIAYGDLSSLMFDRGDYQKSLKYNKEDLAIQRSLGFHKDLALIYNNIASCLIHLEQYDSAIQYSKLALNLDVDYRAKYEEVRSYLNLGSANLKLKNESLAEDYIRKGITLSEEISNADLIQSGKYTLYEVYKSMAEYALALKYLEEHQILRDSVYGLERTRQIAEIETKYETAKKEQLINLLNAEKKTATLKRNSYLIILIALTVTIIILTLWYRHNQKKTRMIRAVEKRINKERLDKYEKELNLYTTLLIQKNDDIVKLNNDLTQLKDQKQSDPFYQEAISGLMKSTILTDYEWQEFKKKFLNVYPGFFVNLKEKYPDLTETEERLFALKRLHLTNKEISAMLGISADSVGKSKYRMKKKLKLSEEDLELLLQNV